MDTKDNRPHKPTYKTISLREIEDDIEKRINKIEAEFKKGFETIKRHTKSVTFFGSARTLETEADYVLARNLARKIVMELPEYSIITGGSSGIMEAANRGAQEAGGNSIGLNIDLPKEQGGNQYLTESTNFDYFFVRKVCLSFSAEAFVFFPGGFGTLDELFEILTLVQTQKIEKRPVILFGREFWQKWEFFIKETLVKSEKIDETDLQLYTITDDENEVLEIIKKTPIRLK